MNPQTLLPSILLCFACSAALAQLPGLPADARLAEERREALAEVEFPPAPLEGKTVEIGPVRGAAIWQAWHLQATDLTTLQVLTPMKDGLTEAGFEILQDCRDRDCGGFDFRYSLDLLPEPAMHVDLGDYRYLLAKRKTGQGVEHVSLVVSRSSDRGFIHVTSVGETETVPERSVGETTQDNGAPAGSPRPKLRTDKSTTEPVTFSVTSSDAPLVETLMQSGRAVLHGLSFETGSSRLADTEFPALRDLADWMKQNPGTRVVLVGHTDTEGLLPAISSSPVRAPMLFETALSNVMELPVNGWQPKALAIFPRFPRT